MKFLKKERKRKTLKLLSQKRRDSSSVRFVFLLAIFGFAYLAHGQSLSDAVSDHKAKLQQQLNQLETEINNFQTLIDGKRAESASLERDIAILDAKIKKAQLEIRAIDLTISTLSDKIVGKEISIDQIIVKVNRQKRSLSELMRTLNEHDSVSMIELMLSYASVSDFLGDSDSIDTIQKSLEDSFQELRSTKKSEETQRDDLVSQKDEKRQLRALQELQKKQIEKDELNRKNLLKVTRGTESQYRVILAVRQKSAASIRSQLFVLQGSPAIPFEKAVAYAESASKKTGVRPAFLLGVIAQESDLGKNIGQCNLPSDPPEQKWQKIMKPTRDQAPYLSITSRLGLDPNQMPLSCPLSVGWGGAMGPAQFIPSTWVLYETKIAQATGHNPPNPWNPEDAFMASSIYLGELGANTVSGERTAAAKYFAGSGWKSSLGRTYANQVLEKVATYQDQLNLIEGVAIR